MKVEGRVAIQPELMNNIGVILMKMRRFDEARKKLQTAGRIVTSELRRNSRDLRMKAINLTIQFNLGILASESYQFGEATMLFKQIIA